MGLFIFGEEKDEDEVHKGNNDENQVDIDVVNVPMFVFYTPSFTSILSAIFSLQFFFSHFRFLFSIS